jgi:type IV pilus assembly protein PilY1
MLQSPIRKILNGNYLNYQRTVGQSNNPNSRATRISLTQDAVNHVINTIKGIRIGLMRFSANNEGGFVDVAVDDIENVRESFVNKVNSYFAWGGTPLSETFYEAALYLRGDPIKYGKYSRSVETNSDSVVLIRNSVHGMVEGPQSQLHYEDTFSVNASRTNAGSSRYLSPITNACQSDSSIILFTDGAPSVDDQSNSAIKQLIRDIDFDNDPNAELQLSKNCTGNGGCADELAYFLFNYDQNQVLPGIQRIRTHVVGGILDATDPASVAGEKLMKSIAKHGGGQYFSADSYETLVKALEGTIGSVADTPATFVAPAISANSYNSLEHLDELYYALFEPSGSAKWKGNLKSYRLSGDGTIRDSKGDKAINSDGVFDAASRSYWTDSKIKDGAKVSLGGAASLLTANKKIYTHLEGNSSKDALLSEILSTTKITKALLGVDSNITPAEHASIINWANRVDSIDSGATRREMEDPLHSRPVVINYKSEKNSEGDVVHDAAVFIATNSGYLHAFKADKNNFEEYFSYIPKELLPNLAAYKNGANVADKVYGLDGPITYWHEDKNHDAIVDTDEKVLLFVGMRRGGRNYYALDVSNPEEPRFAWQILGNSGDFSNLGQSWSEMTLAKVPWEGSHRVVLLFGGGYDPIEDDRTSAGSHSMGNSIYMVDAETGELLWQASKSNANFNNLDMTTSIASNIRPIDYNGDNVTDFFYATDIGGKIWRFDINKSTKNANDFAKGGVIFDANGDSGNTYKRFYNTPSVAYSTDNGRAHLTIAVGSGFRAHPLQNTAADTLYILNDENILNPPLAYVATTPNLLATVGTKPTMEAMKLGWKYQLASRGEKILTKALTTNGSIYFSTFEPVSASSSLTSCQAGAGRGRGYILNLSGGSLDETDPDDPDSTDPDGTGPDGTGPDGTDPKPYRRSSTVPKLEGITDFESPIPPADPEVFLTQPKGDLAFCKENPSHESCQEKEIDDCEAVGAVVLSGTEAIGGGISRCDLLKTRYWRET